MDSSSNGTNRVTRSTSPSPLKKHRHKTTNNATNTNSNSTSIREGVVMDSNGSGSVRPCTLMRSSSQPEQSVHSISSSASSNPVLMMVMGSGNMVNTADMDTTSSNSTIGALNIMSVSDSSTIPSVTLNSPLNSAKNILDPIERQSLKHLSVSAPAIKSAGVIMGTSSSDNEYIFAPTSSKSRQKKFHRHFSNVSQEEKVLDYYSCALVADILLQGYLYITENYFAFYSNVFGYVTKLLIPVTDIVKITKEKTAKIIPNAVGVCTTNEKHVFASLISRDTTYKLMHKVWNYTNDVNAKQIRDLAVERSNKIIPFQDKGSGGDLSIPDESSGESGSGNDSAVEPGSFASSPLNTPMIVDKILGTNATTVTRNIPANSTISTSNGNNSSSNSDNKLQSQQASISTAVINSTSPYIRTSVAQQRTLQPTTTNAKTPTNFGSPFSREVGKQYLSTLRLGLNGSNRTQSLLILATVILVILFLSAGLLLSRISRLQDKLSEKHVFHDSDQFYQELLSWQTKLHSSSAEEIHQYIHMNLKQIVRVRQSLEALSLLFMTNQAAASVSPVLNDLRQDGTTAPGSQNDKPQMAGGGDIS